MKRSLIFSILPLFLIVQSYAEVGTSMCLDIVILDNEDIPTESAKFLEDRIGTILAENDIYSTYHSNRFFLVVKTTVISQSISEGEPPMLSNKVSVTYKIGDVIDNRVFVSFTEIYHGAGVTKQKAWMNTFCKVKNSQNFVNQLNFAKLRITDYYDKQSSKILKLAQSQAESNDYDAALATLSVIPSTVTNYDIVRSAMVEIYKSKCSFQNEQALLSARRLWNASPDYNGASAACEVLSGIVSPSSEILKQMNELLSKIEKSNKIEKTREFTLLSQKIANDHELAMQKANNEANLFSSALQLGYEILRSQFKPISVVSSIFSW